MDNAGVDNILYMYMYKDFLHEEFHEKVLRYTQPADMQPSLFHGALKW